MAYESLTPRTSSFSMEGGVASKLGAFAMSAFAIGPVR
jgi:hypothetical protein